MNYSIIVATYNRLDELKELADSLIAMVDAGLPDEVQLEWVIVDDGSTDGTKAYVENRSFPFPVQLLSQSNQGPGAARNLGMKHAKGDVFIFLDSDCTVPPTYLKAVHEGMHQPGNDSLDAFGGPDTYRDDFSPLLKAINYSMTSFLGQKITDNGSRIRMSKYFFIYFFLGTY